MSTTLYPNGSTVPESGWYQCIACGNRAYFEKGALFIECDLCAAGTPSGPPGYTENDKEYWRFMSA